MPRYSLWLALALWTASEQAQAWHLASPCTSRSPRRHALQQQRRQHHPRSPYSAPTNSQTNSQTTTTTTTTTTLSAKSDIDTDTDTSVHSSSPSLTLYNSKTRSKQVLAPVTPGIFTMYTCGPTVYDYAHVGNFRAFLTYDVLKRVLLYCNYTVSHVCNLTDVDDKIIQRANEQALQDVTELTRKFEGCFMADLAALNIVKADRYPRATQHIPEMMDMILELATKGLAYETADGSWYFATQQQPGYGTQLVQLSYDDMQQTERGESAGKQHFADFCLWKAFKEGVDRTDMAWESDKIQLGRPGWHLECSAMARKFFGSETIDLHGGGVDLKFPHHENEIAQSEGCLPPGQSFCNCWFHNGFVNVDNEKMSKSLGNFLTLRTACPTADDVRAYRYLVVSSQYRNPLAFTPQAMSAAKNAVKRIDKIKAELEKAIAQSDNVAGVGQASSELAVSAVPKAMNNFKAAILDDLAMPRAAACLFALVNAAEGEFKRVAKQGDSDISLAVGTDAASAAGLDIAGLTAILEAMQEMDQIFGIFYQVPLGEGDSAEAANSSVPLEIPATVMDLVAQRTAAKDAKNWELADSFRVQITELGFSVKDVKGGDPVVSRKEEQ